MERFDLPLGAWIEAAVQYAQDHFEPFFAAIAAAVAWLIDGLEAGLLLAPVWVLAPLIVLIAWWRVGWRFAIFAVLAVAVVLGIGLWDETMSTLALITAATAVCLVLGVPLGIWASRSDKVETAVRPVLDLMQTLPPFVYLIPAVMFFELGKVPGAIATIVFAMPPVVRLTSLGIRQVDQDLVEAGLAFGCTDRKLLIWVQLPAAMPSIRAGINQTIMLALSMVVIASMIGAGGLGEEVLRGIERLQIGVGFEGGIAVVLLAILLDRITQSVGAVSREIGPVDLLRRLARRLRQGETAAEGR